METVEEVIVLMILILYQAIMSIACAYSLDCTTRNQSVIKRRRHRWWIRPIINKRHIEGATHLLLSKNPSDGFFFEQYLRLSLENFDFLLDKINRHLLKKDTKCRKSITPSEKLAVTLRYLATGIV